MTQTSDNIRNINAWKPKFHYCIESIEVKCANKTYEPRYGSSECQACPKGYYCSSEGLVEPTICTKGNCQQSGCETENQSKPLAQRVTWTLSNLSLIAIKSNEHMMCVYVTNNLVWNYCKNHCAITPQRKFCETSLNYCPAGIDIPIPCKNGTYSPAEGLYNESQCRSCRAGHYCENNIHKPCLTPGYYCKSGASISNSEHMLCPVGH